MAGEYTEDPDKLDKMMNTVIRTQDWSDLLLLNVLLTSEERSSFGKGKERRRKNLCSESRSKSNGQSFSLS